MAWHTHYIIITRAAQRNVRRIMKHNAVAGTHCAVVPTLRGHVRHESPNQSSCSGIIAALNPMHQQTKDTVTAAALPLALGIVRCCRSLGRSVASAHPCSSPCLGVPNASCCPTHTELLHHYALPMPSRTTGVKRERAQPVARLARALSSLHCSAAALTAWPDQWDHHPKPTKPTNTLPDILLLAGAATVVRPLCSIDLHTHALT